MIWASKSPENSLPDGFAGYWLILTNGQQIPSRLASNYGFDYSLRQMTWQDMFGRTCLAGQSDTTGRILKPHTRHPPHQALYIQELLAHISIGLKPLFIPENDGFQALKASQPCFSTLPGLENGDFEAILSHFQASFGSIAQ